MLFVVGSFKDEPFLFFFKVGSLLFDEDPEQLVIESLVGDHEVDEGDFGGDFRQIVRVSEFGSDVEEELRTVFDYLVSKLDVLGGSLAKCLFQENGRQGRVQFF